MGMRSWDYYAASQQHLEWLLQDMERCGDRVVRVYTANYVTNVPGKLHVEYPEGTFTPDFWVVVDKGGE